MIFLLFGYYFSKTPPNPGKVNDNHFGRRQSKGAGGSFSPQALHYVSSEDTEGETTTTNGPKPRKIKEDTVGTK